MQILLWLLVAQTACAINYLTTTQWGLIKKVLGHPQRTPIMVEQINQVLYQHYKYKAFEMAKNFKIKYSILCRHISTTEMNQYAARGLMLAIKNYNPKYPFSSHFSLYVNSQLYICLTDMQPLTTIPRHLRLSKKWRSRNKFLYKRLTNMKLVGSDNYLYDVIQDKQKTNDLENSSKYDELVKIWSIVNNLDVESQKIMRYKYNFDMKKIRSNGEVGILMCCSDETIRKKVVKIQNIIQKECKKL